MMMNSHIAFDRGRAFIRSRQLLQLQFD